MDAQTTTSRTYHNREPGQLLRVPCTVNRLCLVIQSYEDVNHRCLTYVAGPEDLVNVIERDNPHLKRTQADGDA